METSFVHCLWHCLLVLRTRKQYRQRTRDMYVCMYLSMYVTSQNMNTIRVSRSAYISSFVFVVSVFSTRRLTPLLLAYTNKREEQMKKLQKSVLIASYSASSNIRTSLCTTVFNEIQRSNSCRICLSPPVLRCFRSSILHSS